MSIALGNIVLADHGRTIPAAEPLPAVASPNPALAPVSSEGCGQCESTERLTTLPRFRPSLQEPLLTQAAPYDPAASAGHAFNLETADALPAIRLLDDQGRVWRPQRDLLSSDAFAPEFVVEVENDGCAALRLGTTRTALHPAKARSPRRSIAR